MPTALIDTNVLLAACYGRRAWQSPLLTAWLGGHFDWVTSEALLAEFIQVAARPEHMLRIRVGVLQEDAGYGSTRRASGRPSRILRLFT